MLIDISAFLISARTGGFSAAAREIGTTPSVVSKRVGRLEDEIGTRLFLRTTRTLSLTQEGERLQPRLQQILAELDDALDGPATKGHTLRGSMRVRTPTTVGVMYVGRAITEFQKKHPGVAIELDLIDRQVNPLEENYHISLGAPPASFGGVRETAISPYPRLLVGSPEYLAKRPAPETPGDLVAHECLSLVLMGHSWSFDGPTGRVSVGIHGSFTANDSRVIAEAAEAGMGLAISPEFIVRDALAAGRLVPVMEDYPVTPVLFKAMVPNHLSHRPEIIALVKHFQAWFSPPPWDCEQHPSGQK